MGQKLTRALEAAKTQVQALSKNMFPKASSDNQIDAIIEKVNRAGEAIQNVSSMMQGLTIGDLNFGALGTEVTNFQTKIDALSSELDSKINQGLVNAVTNSTELKQIFTELGTDLSSATATSLFEDLAKGAKAAGAEAAKAKSEYDKIIESMNKKQTTINRLEATPLGTEEKAANVRQQVEELTKQYDEIMGQLREKMAAGLQGKLAGTGLDPNKFLDQFFDGLTSAPDVVKDKIKSIKESQEKFVNYDYEITDYML